MVKKLTTSVKWLIFTFLSTIISITGIGVSSITISCFVTGLFFSVAYLYKEELSRKI
ncbi:hypothetical protein (plasmid) [Metabacillus dongyingensis]|nr:hypothetical protein [Metabacillus dongyingensis]